MTIKKVSAPKAAPPSRRFNPVRSARHRPLRPTWRRAAPPYPEDDGPGPASPAQRLPLPTPNDTAPLSSELDLLLTFADQLPKLNESVISGDLTARDFVNIVQGTLRVGEIAVSLAKTNNPEARFRAQQVLQLVASSLEAHVQYEAAQGGGEEAATAARGKGIDAIPDLAATLLQLSEMTGLMPALSATTLWIENEDHRLAFTSAHDERYFAKAVRETLRIFGIEIPEALAPIQDGELSLRSPDASKALRAAADSAEELYELFFGFPRRRANGDFNMNPEYFMRILRRFLVSIKIKGHLFEGPNATYTPGVPRIDFALGLRRPFYVDIVLSRYRFMPVDYRSILDLDLVKPSLKDRFLDATSSRSIFGFDEDALISGITRDPALTDCAHEFGRLANSFLNFSKLHMGLITHNLVRPSSRLSAEDLGKIVPAPAGGVGGNHLSVTAMINEMRIKDPFLIAMIKHGSLRKDAPR